MSRLVLFHWRPTEATPHVEQLSAQGHSVEVYNEYSTSARQAWRANPPDAFLIDLSRLPSHGREVATALRNSKVTRPVPIVFLEGAQEKIESVKQLLPDATYTTWGRLSKALPHAIQQQPATPVQPVAMMQRYAGRTVAQKLGIVPESAVTLIDAPRDIDRILDPLPEGVTIHEAPVPANVTLWFVREADALYRELPQHAHLAAHSKFWVAWPKRRTGYPKPEVNETLLRDTALPLGLVDYKVCSINDIWSGLCFSLKKHAASV